MEDSQRDPVAAGPPPDDELAAKQETQKEQEMQKKNEMQDEELVNWRDLLRQMTGGAELLIHYTNAKSFDKV